MEVPVFAIDLLRGRAFAGEILWSVPACRCALILLWRIRAGGSDHVRLYRKNLLRDGNIVCTHNS